MIDRDSQKRLENILRVKPTKNLEYDEDFED